MKSVTKKLATWATAACMVMGMTVLPASAASGNAPSIDDVDYSGKGKVQVQFNDNVKYKKSKVTIKDSKGKKYKTSVLNKNKNELSFKIKAFKKNRTYKFKIKGIKKTGTSKFRTVNGKVTIPKNTVAKKDRITVNDAKSIALADAGLTADKVSFIKAKFDYDDGFAVYEVEFFADGVEYEYDISARNGNILGKDIDHGDGYYDDDYDDYYDDDDDDYYDDDYYDSNRYRNNYSDNNNNTENTQTDNNASYTDSEPVKDNNNSNPTYISRDKAISIALSDSGLSKSNTYVKKAHLDREDGIMVYEVELFSGRYEYECEIHAVSGDILKREMEYDD